MSLLFCGSHNSHYFEEYGCSHCQTEKSAIDIKKVFAERWQVDYWKPGEPVFEFYKNKKFSNKLKNLITEHVENLDGTKTGG